MTASYRPLRRHDIDAVQSLIQAVVRHDGRTPLSEHKSVRVGGGRGAVEVVGTIVDEVSAYGQATWHRPPRPGMPGHWGVEIVLAPNGRSVADVAALVAALRARLDEHPVRVWAGAGYVEQGLKAAGYREVRRLHRLRRDLPADLAWPLPSSVRVAPFSPGEDDEAWLALNNAAFAGHPENGALEPEDLNERMAQSWFDVHGFLMAWELQELVGFCWTKYHNGIGEIYIIAVHPAAGGRGLGKGLLAAGLRYLQKEREARSAVLYTESDNEAGMALYKRAGFAIEKTSSQYEKPE